MERSPYPDYRPDDVGSAGRPGSGAGPDYNTDDAIAALATPRGESALALIRLSGAGTLGRLAPAFTGPADLRRAKGHTLHYGGLRDPRSGEEIDRVLVAVYRGPRSYTGEEGAEITCHGGPVVVRRLLDLLGSIGFRPAEPGEFTLRAFLNGRLDLTRAEAVNELIRSRTDRARALALSRLSGSIAGKIGEIREGLVRLAAGVEVALDYPEEEIDPDSVPAAEVRRWEGELERLLATYRVGRIVQEGLTVVIAGRTNAGKSTLFNRLLREDRAIVSEIPGTTRDWLEGTVEIDGIPLRLVDTAGLREAADPLEAEGMRRTDRLLRDAHLVLYLVDAGEGPGPEDERFAAEAGQDERVILLWNKVDRLPAPGAAPYGAAPEAPTGFLPVSAQRGDGLEALTRLIAGRALGGVNPESGAPVIDSARQKELLERARGALADFRRGLEGGAALDLLAVDLKEALDALGEITGEVTTADILERMFRDFCVGK